MTPIHPDRVKCLLAAGKHIGRERYQEGHIEEVGKRIKKWRGFYYIYVINANGSESRRKKTVTLGRKAEMTKTATKHKLRDEIEKSLRQPSQPTNEATLR